MVRLLHGKPILRLPIVLVSIPQWCDCCCPLPNGIGKQVSRFNPTMVRLLLGVSKAAVQKWLSFNPTMVRLLHDGKGVGSGQSPWFQSHNGAIAAAQRAHESFVEEAVSIPQWCDCCRRKSFTITEDLISFNPTMVRLLRKFLSLRTAS